MAANDDVPLGARPSMRDVMAANAPSARAERGNAPPCRQFMNELPDDSMFA